MSERKPKIIKRDEREKDKERSLEVNYLKYLIAKYPEKARRFVKDLKSQINVVTFD